MHRFEPAAGVGAPPRVTRLLTPPVARIVPEGVFDAFAWCESDVLEWRRPWDRWEVGSPVDGSDPARMVFVIHRHVPDTERAPWPRELARLHASGLALADDEALAPWAIDDATDGLHARGVRPRDLFWLAADNLNALFWGLHDWGHFHHHGPFEQLAWTELQCDASALAWLWLNRKAAAIDVPAWERVRGEVAQLTAERFAAEGATAADRDGALALLHAARLQALVDPARTSHS